jgi:hypothetical protein
MSQFAAKARKEKEVDTIEKGKSDSKYGNASVNNTSLHTMKC